MRSSRAPEHRKSSSRIVILLGLFILVVGLGLAITYFTQGFGSLSAETTEPVPAVTEAGALAEPEVISEPSAPDQADMNAEVVVPGSQGDGAPADSRMEPLASDNDPVETSGIEQPADAAKIEDVNTEEVAPDDAKTEGLADDQTPSVAQETEKERNLEFLPQVRFGEVLGEGLMELSMPNGERVDTWYTFQVDTTSGEIIVYFALFDEEKQSILSTVRVDNYSKGNDLTKAEVTLFYPDGMQRVIGFDGVAGTMSLTQRANLPYEPSVFSRELRRSMVYYGMALQDAEADASLKLDLDVTGLSKGEKISFTHSAPSEVAMALEELKELVGVIEVVRQS